MHDKRTYLILGAVALFLTSCKSDRSEPQVISQRFIHKYGYSISQEEWEAKNYPGQIVTTLRDGVTITTSYEGGLKDGPCSYTFPHSQVVQAYYAYSQGNLVKEIHYDEKGMPIYEKIQLSPSRIALTRWYSDGTPESTEEYMGEELMQGEYYTTTNELEAKVEKGFGQRMQRDREGMLISKDTIEQGYLSQKETFYENGSPESIVHYTLGVIDGQKQLFARTGEPLSIEQYKDGTLHGIATYFKNGIRAIEISYENGKKEGPERHYRDGEILSQMIQWSFDKRHGETVFYIDNVPHVEWYYNDELVSHEKFDELYHLDEVIANAYREGNRQRR